MNFCIVIHFVVIIHFVGQKQTDAGALPQVGFSKKVAEGISIEKKEEFSLTPAIGKNP